MNAPVALPPEALIVVRSSKPCWFSRRVEELRDDVDWAVIRNTPSQAVA